MAGSKWPFLWRDSGDGGQSQTLRASIYSQLDLVAQVGAEIGIVSPQWAALRAGQDVTFTTAQLKSWYPRGTEHASLPPDLDAATAWTLRGDDLLVPAS